MSKCHLGAAFPKWMFPPQLNEGFQSRISLASRIAYIR
jgi:hypothetical protein